VGAALVVVVVRSVWRPWVSLLEHTPETCRASPTATINIYNRCIKLVFLSFIVKTVCVQKDYFRTSKKERKDKFKKQINKKRQNIEEG
jgi:hypothetical protein